MKKLWLATHILMVNAPTPTYAKPYSLKISLFAVATADSTMRLDSGCYCVHNDASSKANHCSSHHQGNSLTDATRESKASGYITMKQELGRSKGRSKWLGFHRRVFITSRKYRKRFEKKVAPIFGMQFAEAW